MENTISEETLLCHAVTAGDLSLVEVLLEKGVKTDEIADILFRNACLNGDLSVIRLLLDRGLSFQGPNFDAFKYAAVNGYVDILNFLYQKFPDVVSKPTDMLLETCRKGKLDALEFLVSNFDFSGYALNAGLLEVVKRGEVKAVKILLDAGADTHYRHDESIIEACRQGTLEIVKLLLESGANIYAQGSFKILMGLPNLSLPIYDVIKRNHLDILEYLLDSTITDENLPLFYKLALKLGQEDAARKIAARLSPEETENVNSESKLEGIKEEVSKEKEDNRVFRAINDLDFDYLAKYLVTTPESDEKSKILDKIGNQRDMGFVKSILAQKYDFRPDLEKILKAAVYYRNQAAVDLVVENAPDPEFWEQFILKLLINDLKTREDWFNRMIHSSVEVGQLTPDQKIAVFGALNPENFDQYIGKDLIVDEVLNQALMVAFQGGDKAKMQYCLEHGAKLESPTQFFKQIYRVRHDRIAPLFIFLAQYPELFENVDTDLIQAIKVGNKKLFKKMLKKKIHYHFRDFLLGLAIVHNQRDIFELLLETEDEEFQFYDKEYAVQLTLHLKRFDMLEYLFDLEWFAMNHSFLVTGLLDQAILEKDFDLVKLAIQYGADVDATEDGIEDDMTKTAITMGDFPIFEYVINQAKLEDVSGAIMWTFSEQRVKMMEYIIEKYGFPRRSDDYLVREAVKAKANKCLLLLIDHGANWQFVSDEEMLGKLRTYYQGLPEDHPRRPIANLFIRWTDSR